MLKEFNYVVKPTGADSPSQNGGVEIYNNTLAVKVRTLLYGSGLSAKFWSAALLHAVYLHNRLVHSATGKTPLKAGTIVSQTLRSSRFLDLGFALNGQVHDGAS
jgi:hypothetical protein